MTTHFCQIQVRRAASAYACQGPVEDAEDRKGQRLNAALLAAAVAYAKVALSEADVTTPRLEHCFDCHSDSYDPGLKRCGYCAS